MIETINGIVFNGPFSNTDAALASFVDSPGALEALIVRRFGKVWASLLLHDTPPHAGIRGVAVWRVCQGQ